MPSSYFLFSASRFFWAKSRASLASFNCSLLPCTLTDRRSGCPAGCSARWCGRSACPLLAHDRVGHVRGGAVRLDRQDEVQRRSRSPEKPKPNIWLEASSIRRDEVSTEEAPRLNTLVRCKYAAVPVEGVVAGQREIRQQAVPRRLDAQDRPRPGSGPPLSDRAGWPSPGRSPARDRQWWIRAASPTVSVSTIGSLRIVRVEIDADLLAQRVFPLRQGELRLRHAELRCWPTAAADCKYPAAKARPIPTASRESLRNSADTSRAPSATFRFSRAETTSQ